MNTKDIEATFHEVFREKEPLIGEWFKLSKKEVSLICNVIDFLAFAQSKKDDRSLNWSDLGESLVVNEGEDITNYKHSVPKPKKK